MKKLRFCLFALLICSIAIIPATLFTKDINIAQAATAIRLSDKTLSLELGHYKTLRIYGTTRTASWHSSNNWVATVSSSGKVTAKAAGTATITAKVNGQTLTCKLSVFRIRDKAVVLSAGQSKALKVSGPVTGQVTYSSNNPSVASVSTGGIITAVAPGTATVTTTVGGINISSSISVVSLNTNEAIMEFGGFSGYTKTLKVNNAAVPVIWTSSNTSVATVSSIGKVSAKGPGTAVITADINGAVLTCNIKVLAENTREFTLKLGETKKLTILGTTSKVIWHSNKKSVALVSEDGTVSTVAPGSAIIMAYVDGRNVMSRVTVVNK